NGTNYNSAGPQSGFSGTVGPCKSPSARHVYSNTVFDPDIGQMLMTCCFVADNAGGSLEVWRFDDSIVGSNNWSRDTTCCLVKPDGGQNIAAYEPLYNGGASGGKLWSGQGSNLYYYVPATRTWSSGNQINGGVNINTSGMMGVDTDRHLLVMIGENAGAGGN